MLAWQFGFQPRPQSAGCFDSQHIRTAKPLVTWPANATNWTLLQNTNLATTNWTAFATANVGNNGILKTATNQPAGGNKFFRLVHP